MIKKINRSWNFQLDIPGSPLRTVDLPHDWSIEGEFSPENYVPAILLERHLEYRHDSFLPTGSAVYSKMLDIEKVFDDQQIFLEFDGVFGKSELFVDDVKAGGNNSGYTGIVYDITKLVNGKQNVKLTMPVDGSTLQGWWYEGCGIYRDVHMHIKPACHIVPWGVAITTPEISEKSASAAVSCEIKNASSAAQKITVSVRITAPDGSCAAAAEKNIELAPGTVVNESFLMAIDAPHLWDIDDPALYKAEITVESVCGKDSAAVNFGIRYFEFTPDKGFFLNGRHLQLRGGNLHHDFGGLGTALPPRAHEKNVEVLKEMGCNIIRSSHNPAAPALMDACDRLGMLFWAETRNLHPEKGAENDLVALIRRDRNHPSIITWSLANIAGARDGKTYLTDKLQILHDLAKKIDPSRLTSVGLEGNADANANKFALVTDIVGYNGGGMGITDRDHKAYPDRCCVVSEYASGRGTRGVYAKDETPDGEMEVFGDGRTMARDGKYSTEYDLIDAHIREWEYVMYRPYLAGGLMWSAIEYRGETSGYPVVTSQFGPLDICRFPKDVYYYYKKLWTKEPMVHAYPPWNHKAADGTIVNVNYFTNCDHVEIYLNGKQCSSGYPIHLQKGTAFPKFTADVPFEKGTLDVIGFVDGKEVCRHTMRTPEAPAAVSANADRMNIAADGEDLSFIRVDILDKNGTFVPDAAEMLKISVSGAGKLLGVCSGDPKSHESEKADHIRTFSGSALVIVQSNGQTGKINVKISSGDLAPACLELDACAE